LQALFSALTLVFDLPATGGVQAHISAQSSRLYRVSTASDRVARMFLLFLGIAVVYASPPLCDAARA
jgi:hypothetical protein